jgi:hypothetical protein
MGRVVQAGWWFRAGVLVLGLTALVPRIAAGQCSSTTTLACGETKSGTLSMLGETDCFTFDAVAGETVNVTTSVTAGVFQPCWEIKAPGGASLTLFCGGQDERTLPSTGTYTIEVSDLGDDQTGIYDVSMVVVSDTVSSCAETITCGPTLPRSLVAVAENDTFKFAGQVGDTVSITAQETGGGMAACWELYNPSGQSLGGLCGQGERTLAVTGGHTIRIYDLADNNTGTYDLNFAVVSDSSSTCGETISCGQTISRTTALVGESDTFTFDAAATETVSITAQETGGGTITCWTLYDPAGLQIDAACGQHAHTLAEGGLYTIRVHDLTDTLTGSYDLNLTFVSDTASSCAQPVTCGQPLVDHQIAAIGESRTYTFAAVANETVSITAHQTSAFILACWELYDPAGISVVGACGRGTKTLAVPGNYTIRVFDNGDDQTGTFDLDLVFVSDTGSSCAEGLMCGDALPRELTAIGQSQTFRYEAAAGEAVSISAQETGGFVSACWEVYDPAGVSLGGSCAQGEKTFAAAGGYTIRISDDNDSEIGTYSLNLVVLSDTEHNCATPLACGQTATGSVSQPGESRTYAVSGQTGDVVAIDTIEIGGALDACWEFYDPAGTSLGGMCGMADRTLATDLGVHTVRVYDLTETHTGDFQVSLCNPTTTTTGGSSTTTTTVPTAGGDFPISGASLVLKDSVKTQKRKLVVVSKDSSLSIGLGAGTDDDPTQKGSSLRVRSAGGGFDATYDLEPIGWRPLKKKDPSKGWKYTKGNAIKLALLKAGRSLRIVGRGAALQHALATPPSPVDVVFSLGARRYCMTFGGATKFKVGASFSAKDAPPPATCPAP